jgi:hypothetical protein
VLQDSIKSCYNAVSAFHVPGASPVFENLTPEFIRAIQGLEFGTLALIGSAMVVLATILIVKNVVKNQGEERKADAKATQLQFDNQAKLIGHIGTQSAALEKMADAMTRMSGTQQDSAESSRELARINTEGFAKTSDALSSLSERVDTNQAATLGSLKELRDDMAHVKQSLVRHTESYSSLASRLDVAIAKLDSLIAPPSPPSSAATS